MSLSSTHTPNSLKKNEKNTAVIEVDSVSNELHNSVSRIGGLKGHTERKLKPRHIDLISIGGAIGTALFVTIGTGLHNGGCVSLLLAY
ncbi:unnamed protein product [Ambrosiozyma monospora]|uniref:Unnamed protein product n=1 Tax=Ambrosiozyma monospora TaxID=43982 RepID=A0ACB5TQH8_AMBMO|nr:unnamed protein product [Ambrosiozyma monospora]